MKERPQKVEIGPVTSQRRKRFWKREWIPASAATKKEKEDRKSTSVTASSKEIINVQARLE
jgi:hypothetical protein